MSAPAKGIVLKGRDLHTTGTSYRRCLKSNGNSARFAR